MDVCGVLRLEDVEGSFVMIDADGEFVEGIGKPNSDNWFYPKEDFNE